MYPLLDINGWEIPAYNLCASLAAIAGFALALPALRRAGLRRARAMVMLLLMAAAFLIGARLWNVAANPSNFHGALRWYSLRWAGLSFYGGVLGATMTLVASLRLWKQPVWAGLDAMTLPGAVAFCIARVGCFLNGCCAGRATSGPLGVVFPSKAGYQQALSEWLPFLSASRAVHPTQLYELAGAALGLPLMFWLVKRLRLRQGAFFLLYAAWFSAVRLAMLPLRALTYPDIIKTIIYPLLYVTIILLGIITTLRREF
ncbi:MAG: prolipoprotein diacylglyceryl transferase [Clostridiales bacterium]|jgi:phosphatidylglycerol:prolipoprotein diacylglycerol transferase|nr:prolipoprotein diacylglyceryl transferase [Clostridiales bacterium]